MIEIKSNQFDSVTSIERNKTIPIKLESKQRMLPICDISLLLDEAECYRLERDSSTCYRFNFDMNMLASNPLFNISGECSLSIVDELRNFDPDDMVYEFERDEIVLKENGWFYYLTGDTFTQCERKYLEPNQEKLYYVNSSGETNWSIHMTYPSVYDDTLEFDGVPLSGGIRISNIEQINFNNREMLKFVTSIPHGLDVGDSVRIINNNYSDDPYEVYKIGNENNQITDNIFIVDSRELPINAQLEPVSMKQVNNGTELQYYRRDFRKLTNENDICIHLNAFSRNIFSDKKYALTIEKTIDVADLRDGLNLPIDCLYLTVVKSPCYKQPNENFFTNVKSGIYSIAAFSEYDISTVTELGVVPAIEDDVNINSNTLFGDIVSYDPQRQEITILAEAYHRFNTLDRFNNGYYEGYKYRPHCKIQIRQFENDVNETFVAEDAPDYAKEIDGKYYWRNLSSNTFIDDENIPFLNNCHYIFKNHCFLLERQDPCMEFSLGDYVFSGDCVTFADVTTIEDDDVC